MEQINSFNALFENSVKEHWNLDALTDYRGQTLQYQDLARKIEKLHILFEICGLEKGDKVALCGRNMSNWIVAFFATLSYGAVAVPVLHEFTADQIHNIVNHSGARLLFVGDFVAKEIDPVKMPELEGIINIVDYSLFVSRTDKLTYAREHLNELFGRKYPKYFRKEMVDYYKEQSPEELAVINYTSGTTGFSKGVMIPYRALWSNCMFAVSVMKDFVKQGENIISILPMAHMYGLMFENIFELVYGCHVHYLNRAPSPAVMFQAFQEIKPRVIIAVPLIIEKIIKKKVLPKLQTHTMRVLLNAPIISGKVKERIREQVLEAFGGNVYEVIVGGAAFNQDVEKFLRGINFPVCVGYGATECAPILAYQPWNDHVLGSCGKAVINMELEIDSPDPRHIPGEILAKGMNVMLGYYKNEEATSQALDKNGWYHTGDLGIMDSKGNVFIKGRSKNMLLGASGQNIFPEEIEDALNSLPLVLESVVVQRGDKLVGLVYPDKDDVQKQNLTLQQLNEQMELNRQALNASQPPYCKLTAIELMDKEFEKTPKHSIKRFLYK